MISKLKISCCGIIQRTVNRSALEYNGGVQCMLVCYVMFADEPSIAPYSIRSSKILFIDHQYSSQTLRGLDTKTDELLNRNSYPEPMLILVLLSQVEALHDESI